MTYKTKYKRKNKGDQVILMGDINTYIGSKKIHFLFANIWMRELFLERHGHNIASTALKTNRTNQLMIFGDP